MALSRNAAALVVGIDHYDDPSIPALSGSTYDATIAVRWLIAIGVDPGRIRLHVSPMPSGSVYGVEAGPADFKSIAASFAALSKDAGDQLFLFLSGHGLYVPGVSGGPIFLTQDYGPDFPNSLMNMRLHGFIQWMLSWRFREQFLFYDACQNPSSSVGRVSLVQAVDPPMLAALPAAAAAGLLACFSASPGQKAWAGEGRGVLVRHLLDQLDPATLAALPADAQQQDAVIYDWTTGARRVDLRPLFEDIIAPAITAAAAAAGIAQNPACAPFGLATSAKAFPILDLPLEQSSDLAICVRPLEAIPAVERVMLSTNLPPRSTHLPQIGQSFRSPSACKGPAAAEILASCRTRSGAAWRVLNSPQRATLGGDPSVVVFEFDHALPLGPSGPTDKFNIRVSDPGGAPAHPMTHVAYDEVVDGMGPSGRMPLGVRLEHHENGPDIGFDPGIISTRALAESSANAWLRAIRDHLSAMQLTATLYPPGIDPEGRTPNIRFGMGVGGASGLAGFLAAQSVVSLTAIGDSAPSLRRSLAEIERHPLEWADGGTYRLTIELPWGRWSRLVMVPESGGPMSLCLPDTIGREPLRNAWLRSMGEIDPPALDEATKRRLPPGLADAIRLIARETDDDVRVEPFSRTALPEWDMLFSAGRLDQVGESRIRQLALEPSADLEGQERDLLLLGLAHAAHSQGHLDALRTVLIGITGPMKRSLDHVLLAHLLRTHDGSKSAITQAENIIRYVEKFDYLVAAPIILGWTAGLIAPLFARAGAAPPDWMMQLSNSSLISVRKRADADRVDAMLSAPVAAPRIAEPPSAYRPFAISAEDATKGFKFRLPRTALPKDSSDDGAKPILRTEEHEW